MKEIQLHRLDLNLLVVFQVLMAEGSVVRAAEKLGKTPSAVSHALARLREQVGDPLMVRVGGRLQASPFALHLIEEVVPILGQIKRVLQLPEPFDPATSTRTFRVASPISAGILARVMAGVAQTAPGVRVEWLPAPREVYPLVSQGQIDLAHLGGDRPLPDGLDMTDLPPMRFVSFVRAGHPAIGDWGPEAWQRHGHIKVAIDNEVPSPVDRALSDRLGRHIAVRVAEFAGVAPLLAASDLIATLPTEIMARDMQTHGLVPLPPVAPMPPLRARLFWSSRTSNDPPSAWLRALVADAFREGHAEAEQLVAARLGEPTERTSPSGKRSA